MPHFNQATLVGHLTADPELKYTPSGAAICKFGLAVNSPYTDKQGNKREDTMFIDIDVWEKQAENCANYLSKGKAVLVSGQLKLNVWEDADGKKNRKHYIRAMVVQFLSAKGDNEDSGGSDKEDNSVPF